jgi:predicted ATPase
MLIQLAYQINDNNENIGFIKSFEASGEEYIKKFSLNTEQETTFTLFTDLNNAKQRIVYCGGEGGTGKSQIINAIADFFDNNNMKNRLFIGAFTGTPVNEEALYKFSKK